MEEVKVQVPNQWSSKCNVHTHHLGISLKVRPPASGLRWSLTVCLSHKLPGDAKAAGPRITLRGARDTGTYPSSCSWKPVLSELEPKTVSHTNCSPPFSLILPLDAHLCAPRIAFLFFEWPQAPVFHLHACLPTVQ